MTNVMVESVHFDACEELNGMVNGGINFEKGPIKGGNAERSVHFYKLYFFSKLALARFSACRFLSARPDPPK